MKKRLLSFALAMLMIALAVPTVVFPVFATEEATATVSKWEPGNAVEAPNLLPRDSDLIRFFRWYKSDDLTTPLPAGTELDDSCVAVINPDLIAEGVFTAEDTLESAYAKFCAYMKQQNLVTPVNSDWSYGNVKSAGTFTEAKYYAHYHNHTLFLVRGGKIEIGDSNEYIVPEADFNRMTQYLMSDALSKNVIMDVSSGEGVAVTADSAKTVKVKDISVTWSSNVGAVPQYTYLTNGSTAIGYLDGHMYPGWGGNDQAGFRWTALKDGEVTFTLDAVTSDKEYTWKIMLNDEFLQETWQNAAQNSVAEVNAAFADLGAVAVKKGDTVTLVIERPASSFTPTITASFVSASVASKWEPNNAVEAPNLLPRDSDLIRFFRWYKSDDLNTPLAAGTTLDASCVAVINPDLIAEGVFTAEDTLESAYAKFCAYMKQQNLVTPVNSDWCYGNVKEAGTFTQAKYYAHYHNHTLFLVRGGKIEIGDLNQYVAPEADFDRMTKYLMSDALAANVIMDVSSGEGVAVTADSAKTVKVKDISVAWSSAVSSIKSYTYLTDGSTALGFLSGQMYPGWGGNDQAGFRWTAPKDGEVTLTLDAVSSNAAYTWKIMLNDEFLQDTWQNAAQNSVAEVNAAFADLGTLTVKKGDTITLVIERPASYFTPTITADFLANKDVLFLDKDGEEIFSTSVRNGSAMPKAPYAAAAEGWIINGEAATELPETVTEDMEIKYAGDFSIADVAVEAASISVSSNFAINLFLRADAYAVSAGVADDFGEQYVGTLQDDGTYKVTIPGVNAKDMAKPFTLCLFQEFADGKSYDNEELHTVVPADILAAYADSDATDAEKAIAAAALDYTKAASAYFAGEALDAEVAARLAEQDAAIAELASDVQSANGGDYMIDGVTLILRDQVGFKVRVVSSMYTELDDSILGYSVTVEGNGKETPFTGFAFKEDGDGYSAVMSLGGVAAADFDVTYKITVKDADGFAVSDAFEYSVNDYIARMFDANAKDANIIRAIYALGVAANNA